MNELISKIGLDKCCHLALGGWIVQIFSLFGFISSLIGLFVLFIVSLYKEKNIDEAPDWQDIKYSMIGGIIALLIGLL